MDDMSNAAKCVLGIMMIFLGVFWYGYAMSVMWGWFVVPLGGPAISLLHACGLSALLSLSMNYRGLNLAEIDFSRQFVFTVVHPAIALLFGYAYKTFM